MEYGIIRGLCWYRLVTAFWALGIVVVTFDKIEEKSFAILAISSVIIFSVLIFYLSRTDLAILLRPGIVLFEFSFAITITVLGGYLYQSGTSANTLAFASHFVLVSVLMCGVAFGMWGGIVAGVTIGAARYLAGAINTVDLSSVDFILSILSTAFTYAIAGALVGGVVSVVRRIGGELSEARARDSIARTLHDGVLQTLVIIKKRSKEKEIVELAEKQESELREFLFKHQANVTKEVLNIHDVIKDATLKFKKEDIDISIVIAPDSPMVSKEVLKAISGTLNEVLMNIVKHADAKTCSIYVEPVDDYLSLNVRDDGKGFDVDKAISGDKQHGIKSSIISRIDEVGGSVKISSTAQGTNVELIVPALEVRSDV